VSSGQSSARPSVLVTGASGLIGGLTISNLGQKYAFSGLSRRPVAGIPHIQADISDLDAVQRACRGVDMVLHLAAETQDYNDWDRVFESTMRGTVNVYQAAVEAGVKRVVFMSSGSTMCGYEWFDGSPYGALARGEEPAPGWQMLDYRDPPRPDGPYAVGKLFGENAGRWYSDQHGLSVLCIRLGAVLPGDQPELVRHFPGYLSQADAVQMIDRCLAAPLSLKYGIFDAISENSRRWRDTSHAKEVLGWRPGGSSDSFDLERLRKPATS
jgi:NAD+ dependent glucose-6-phosphate dehydrogenase